MTRQQAVETALEKFAATDEDEVRAVAEHAYDLGRVAGMREAARRATPHAYYPDRDILRTANALARKLRDGRKR